MNKAFELIKEKLEKVKKNGVTQEFYDDIDHYEQLAGWLEELKDYRKLGTVRQVQDFIADWRKYKELGNLEEITKLKEDVIKVKNEVIDEFAYKCKEHLLCKTFGLHPNNIDEIAEQLKGDDGKKDCCGTCEYAHYDKVNGYTCCNPKSNNVADFVEYEYSCEKYREKEK